MKTIAIMQPYFMPYLGYFQLIQSVDEFVVYDNIQFTKKGWFHRNRISVNGTDLLFTLPLKKDSDYLSVGERRLSDDSDQEIERILRVITMSYKKAPYFEQAYTVIERCFKFKDKNLFKFIFNSLHEVTAYLGIENKFVVSSAVPIDHENLKGQDKVLAICKAQGADHYTNSIGGQELYDKAAFEYEGVDLKFIKMGDVRYQQLGNEFVPALSIIDVMMFNSPETIQEMLGKYELI
jgi:hypothetical protein